MTSQEERPPTQPRPHSKVEDQVIEILSRVDRSASPLDRVRMKVRQWWFDWRRQFRRQTSQTRSRRGSETYLIGCVAAAIVAVLIRDTSALLATILAIVSVALLIFPIVEHLRNPRQPTIKQWRGRDVDLRPASPPWVEALKERFRRPPRP
jgi:Flp pilus assembly protein TadB